MHDEIEVRRSTRRRRTVSARREGNRIIVLIPAALSAREERMWVTRMTERLKTPARSVRNDSDLMERATSLSARYLGGHAKPRSIRWVSNQHSRWGSCTPREGSIRISERVQGMPNYVIDYVILHELAHLLVAGHGRDFWTLLRSYRKLERARGFLDGVALARSLSLGGDIDAGDEGSGVASNRECHVDGSWGTH